MCETFKIRPRHGPRPKISTRIEFPHLCLSYSYVRGNPTLITDLPLSTLFRLGGQL